jgi:phenylpropionate dioxygenase-like ring-hydroxylating dioxygenase large terminal subunit
MDRLAQTPRVLAAHERSGLPAWTFTSQDLFTIEKQVLFRSTWQIACHTSNVPEPGDYQCFDIAGERGIVVRGADGGIRAFHNVCRHRGSRVVAEERGHCKSALVCPFHGWSYNLDGTLRAVPFAKSLPKLDATTHGLVPLELEVWHGFVFVRFQKGQQPALKDMLAPHEHLVAPYDLASAEPLSAISHETIAANWKCVRDVDNEGYHVPMAHPALQDLYGQGYRDDTIGEGVTYSRGNFNRTDGRYWSVRAYRKTLPDMEHLPAHLKTSWNYLGLFPNTVIMLYPDMAGFYQELPIAPDCTIQRMGYYARPDQRRETRLSRYLARRIDRMTGSEDTQLIKWSHEAMTSSGFKGFILSDLEAGVRDHHDMLRRLIPVMGLAEEPRNLATRNAEMADDQQPVCWGH